MSRACASSRVALARASRAPTRKRALDRSTRSRAVATRDDARADVESDASALSRALESIRDADVNVVVVERDDARKRFVERESLVEALRASAAFERAVTFRKAPTMEETARARRRG